MTNEENVTATRETEEEVPVVEAYRMDSKLPSAGVILRDSWTIFKSRFWTFAAISFVPFLLPGIIAFAIGMYSGYSGLEDEAILAAFVDTLGWTILILIGLAAFVVTLVLLVLSQPAMLFAARGHLEKMTVRQAYAEARKHVASFLWVSLLSGLAIMSSMLLLVIPGIIVAVFVVVAPLVVLFEEEKGINALFKSREYVRGNFWKVLSYGLVTVLISAIIGLVISIPKMLGLDPVTDLLDFLRTFLLDGFWFAYAYVIYRYLKASKPSLGFVTPGKNQKRVAVGLITFAILVILSGIVAAAIGFSMAEEREAIENEQSPSTFELPVGTASSSTLSF
ncbi:MAG TPA: hypothetical protein VGE62_00360 [Candidatus Paceibacterota bacterium]